MAGLLALDVPFYTAIGYSGGLHLADLYADEAYVTPSYVGVELGRIIEEQQAARQLLKLQRLQKPEVDLTGEVERLKVQGPQKETPQVVSRGVPLWVVTLIVLLAGATLLLWCHFRCLEWYNLAVQGVRT